MRGMFLYWGDVALDSTQLRHGQLFKPHTLCKGRQAQYQDPETIRLQLYPTRTLRRRPEVVRSS